MIPPDGSTPTRGTVGREDDVLQRIAQVTGLRTARGDEVHIGDDAAVLAPVVGQAIVSVDTAVLGVHLDAELFSLEDLGYKSVAAAMSDLAAMGAWPRAILVAVTAPPGTDLVALHRGVGEAARDLGCPVVGGDLSRGSDVAVAVTVLGECPSGGAVLRSGARPGDEIVVTGALGGSAAGLRRRRAGAALDDPLVRAHRRPHPRLVEGVVARQAGVHAMMDISDGLALDLHRLADASGVGFELTELPVSEGATPEEARGGGEDYELLLTTSDAEALRVAFAARGCAAPLGIGRVVVDPATRTLGGRPLGREGFQHAL